MESLLISACLLGANCKYSGGSNRLDNNTLSKLKEKYKLIPVCPEVAGGLPTPRKPSEINGEYVFNIDGLDVTEEFCKGAEIALSLAKRFGCSTAILKDNSPSCGNGFIYDGSFSGVLTTGYGITAKKLKSANITVLGECMVDTVT